MEHWQGTVFEGLSRLPAPAQERFVELFRKERVSIEIYTPRGTDPRQTHDQEEIHVVISGTDSFVAGESRRPFLAGDAIFVAAGIVHRFVDFTEDRVVWVVFD